MEQLEIIKPCTKCKKVLDVSNFNKDAGNKSGLASSCKACVSALGKKYRQANRSERLKSLAEYRRSELGKLLRLFLDIKKRLKHNKHYLGVKLTFSKEEFFDWALKNSPYLTLHKKWQEKNFESKYAPSIDRIDDVVNKDYSLDNIRFISWEENNRSGLEKAWSQSHLRQYGYSKARIKCNKSRKK